MRSAKPEGTDMPRTVELNPEHAERISLIQCNEELFQILALEAEGDAKLLVKSVGATENCEPGRSATNTTTARLHDDREVLYARMDEVAVAVTQWEDRLKKLEKDGSMPDIPKVAALVVMMPPEVQGLVCISLGELWGWTGGWISTR